MPETIYPREMVGQLEKKGNASADPVALEDLFDEFQYMITGYSKLKEKADKWDKKLEFLINQGLNEKEAEQFGTGVDKAFIEEAVRLTEEIRKLITENQYLREINNID